MTITHLRIPGRIIAVPPIEVEVEGLETWIDEDGILRGRNGKDFADVFYELILEDGTKETGSFYIPDTENGMNILQFLPKIGNQIKRIKVTANGNS